MREEEERRQRKAVVGVVRQRCGAGRVGVRGWGWGEGGEEQQKRIWHDEIVVSAARVAARHERA